MRQAAWLVALVVSIASCSSGLPPPETTAREIVAGALARDLAVLTSRLSGKPLKDLLATGNRPAEVEAVCRRIVRLSTVPSEWRLRFARAIYQDDGSSVNLHLCLQHKHQDQLGLAETFWRMSYVDGGWKLVAYE
jgi:hypothetical protein